MKFNDVVVIGLLGVMFLVFLWCIGYCIYSIIQNNINKKKIKRAYQNQDIQKAKKVWELENEKFCAVNSEYYSLMYEIDSELKIRPYLTKVAIIKQDNKLEKLRIRLESVLKEKEQISETAQGYRKTWDELKQKYGIYGL